ncbi:LIM and calponin homology domains-containing protein 1 isoform X3 [Chiroxiphia lanceolata]|uniref:LIM and calponin homology domains-containing protein 1 isoform X3 n=1 Tax=Chiroxiphia lanceolata TaxID=296741 RepID=UPI0013CE89F8|nr:LIM and calponin homology domains-containing protein 1 isoform X3 [Chiroxiphia lanceolata]
MASPGLELGEVQPPPEPPQPELAFTEAQKWIEQVTGRSFGEKDFRSGLENGILLCELLNAIKPGLVKKINRLPTPIAGLDNIILFLRGCKELGLKESQLFDPGDLQDTSNRVTIKNIDYSRKLKNVLVTIYWLGKAANSCTSYSGSTLNLKEFEGFLAQMRKETEDIESPKRSIRDSGYIDCWDSERSDSLSPPRHGRDDSFDSLDSFGSRSQQTPSPDVVLRGSSDGRGSDSETDLPHRKMPDVKKDDMLARRTSHGEPKSAVPFNQYLPNKSNQTFYVPAPLRKKKAEREEYRKSWSTATSPLGDRPFSKSHPETIEEELNETSGLCEKEKVCSVAPEASSLKNQLGLNQSEENSVDQSPSCSAKETSAPKGKDTEEIRKLRRLEQAGIKVMSAAQRYGSTVTREESQEQLAIPQLQSDGTENNMKFPDPQRDDMLARRTGAFLKQPGPNVKQFLPMPFSKHQNKQGTTTELEKKTTRPEKCPQVCINISEKPAIQPPQEQQQGQEKDSLPPTGQDEIICTAQVGENGHNEVQFGQTSKLQEVPEENKMETLSSKDEHLQIFGPRTAVSDDAESMSMFDMRCEEEAVTQPHSKARHEKLQNIHNQLKEDETRWQDDLARWKSRRRSASQDLIKKEAERKKMERLLSGDGTSERRKSIKTYREIVEEKERRERELHEAYKNAKTQEEAESILQQYIERFTISEAVLERLQMPKILERSHSVEPNSPLKDPNPLRYLRQQSLPAPKFTATIEATIVPTTELEPSGSTGRTSPSKSTPKAVPMLTPKPYSQPKNTQEVLKNFKVDGKVSMNGENVNGTEEKDKECSTVIFTPSPSRSLKFDGVARGDRPPIELKKDPPSVELSLQRPATQSVHKEPTASPVEADGSASPQAEPSPNGTAPACPVCPSPGSDQKQFKSTAACASPVVKRLEFLPSPVPLEEAASSNKDVKKAEMEQQKEAELPPAPEVMKTKALEQKGSVVLPFLKKLPETNQVTLHNSVLQAESDSGDKSNRFNFWSWDPEEERKRQERWQHEQERLLQEKYQKEQDKLKEEWEKAQREVEEEERRYYEEERKIIEDTVVPFIVSSNSAELLSSSSSTTDGNKTVNSADSNSCPEEGKQKEVTRQKKLLWEQDSMPSLKSKENELWQEKRSGNKVLSGYPETGILKGGSEQEHHMPMMEHSSPARLNLPLTQDVSWNQQLLTNQSPHRTEDIRQRPFSGQIAGQQPSSAGEARRAGYHENFRSGPSSPCSPAALSQSPNRSVSGKKLCSTCGLPLGKGAAMIIETLGLYFHIQCFRCGICKGQLGDAASGTDVRIRNGLLNCNDCYIRSRTAGQPTTL